MTKKNTMGSFEDSICKDCVYMVERVIVSLDEELYEIDRNELEVGEDEVLFLNQHVCVVLDADLDDHVVIKCNKHRVEKPNPIFMHQPIN